MGGRPEGLPEHGATVLITCFEWRVVLEKYPDHLESTSHCRVVHGRLAILGGGADVRAMLQQELGDFGTAVKSGISQRLIDQRLGDAGRRVAPLVGECSDHIQPSHPGGGD